MSASRARNSSSRSSYSTSDRSSSSSDDDEEEREGGREGGGRRRPRVGGAATDRSSPRSKSSSPGGGVEGGRTRVIVTHREPTSFGTTSKQLRWQRLEPKFEPRFDYYRGKALEGVRRDTAYYFHHRRKVIEAKPVVDNRPPQVFPHLYCNMRKLRINQERQGVIEKENRMLLGKLYNTMTTSRVDNRNTIADSRYSPGRRRDRYQRQGYQNEAGHRKWPEGESVHASRDDYVDETNDRSPTRYGDERTRDHEGESQRGSETRSKISLLTNRQPIRSYAFSENYSK